MKFQINDTVVLCRHFKNRRRVSTFNFKISGITKNRRYNVVSLTDPRVLLYSVKSKYLRKDAANEIISVKDIVDHQ